MSASWWEDADVVRELFAKSEAEKEAGELRVISGGQTGADRAGLEAAKALGLATGGTAPLGFMTSAGRDRALGSVFGLCELRARGVRGYIERSKRNVDDSDATVAFRNHESAGTDKTIGYCRTGKWRMAATLPVFGRAHRPVHVIDCEFRTFSEEEPCAAHASAALKLRTFIRKYNVRTLNVCGHRQDASRNVCWQSNVTAFLVFALKPLGRA